MNRTDSLKLFHDETECNSALLRLRLGRAVYFLIRILFRYPPMAVIGRQGWY